MDNLFWKTKTETKRLLATPFKTEEEFERTIFDTSELLGDIFLLKRQIRGGNKSGIPDIIGIDTDGNVCIVEMKNVDVGAEVIPQVLKYAIWAETNPDSIKTLWLECQNKPEDINISWDEVQVRILVIAPKILRSTLTMVDKINYSVDLIEVNRWIEGDNELLLVNKLEHVIPARVRTTSGLQEYDEDFYKSNYNSNSAVEFLKYANMVDQLCKKQKWPLELKFNKTYCSFKAGNFNAFGIHWMNTKKFAFFFKVGKDEAEALGGPLTKYELTWKQAYFSIEPGTTKVQDFIPLFELAKTKLAGN